MRIDCRKSDLKRLLWRCFLFASLTVSNVSARESYLVERVIDGDTIVLSNKQTVRLLGINTPEIAYRGKPSDAGALAAKDYLKRMLFKQRVWLEHDSEWHDKYGRSLAQVFLVNGEHVNVNMLHSGLATLSLHPPNLKYSKVLMQAQQQAEKQRLGIWGMDAYAVQRVSKIAEKKLKKWGRFVATISKVGRTKKGAKLWLGDKTYIWIAAKHQRYFPDLADYLAQRIEIRGWPRKWGNNWSIRAIHPSQIILSAN
jgi:endonuclease YncB( thermonuclease family)